MLILKSLQHCKNITLGNFNIEKHKCGTDRIAYALKTKKYDQIINIQGDELINPNNIDKVIKHHRSNKNFDIILPNLKLSLLVIQML